ncbi:MAG TPA: hypothetical protein VGD66_04765 [Allosphingosinicella sp.]
MSLATTALRDASLLTKPVPRRQVRGRAPLVGACAIALLLSGCAARWVDGAGRVHVVGLVAMTVEPHPAAGAGASLVSFESIGAGVTRTPNALALSLGYSKDELTFVPIKGEPAPGGERNHDVASPP